MKIAYDYQIYASQKYGGVSRYFFELANQLAGCQDVKCRIISPVYINQYLLHSRQRLQITGVSVPALPRTGRVRYSINRLFTPLVMCSWHPDIVHETYFSPIRVGPCDSRIVVTVHDMIHELYPEYFPNCPLTEYKRLAVERADHVICISENTRQDLYRLFNISPEKTTVIHHGFSLTSSSPSDLPGITRPFILYVGSRGGYKNFSRLLYAYSSRSELRDNFDIVVFGGGCLGRHEIQMIEHMQIPLEQVRQMSGNDDVLAALYKKAVLFVYPSLYEGFGIPLLEAMSFGCPVACSNTSSMPEVVGGAAVQFDPLVPDSIASSLIRLSFDTDLRKTSIDLGRARVANFSWEECAAKTLDVYRALMK